MSANSKIEWTDATWNPVRGCSRVSEGCRNCYAERIAARFAVRRDSTGPADGPFAGFARVTDSGPRWTGKVELIPEMLEIPLHWKKPRRIFVNSMSDLFHEKLWARDIDKVFAVMSQSPQHTFQILTKRPKQMLEYMRAERTPDGIDEAGEQFGWCHANVQGRWPLPNVWLGVSVEDHKNKDRIDLLRETPAAVRFLSLEPVIEDLGELDLRAIHWVIAGGESGPGARPMHPQWARDIRDQCVAAGAAFFFKQWGEWIPGAQLKGNTWILARTIHSYKQIHEWQDCVNYLVGKKAAGRLLDGREWNEFPNNGALSV